MHCITLDCIPDKDLNSDLRLRTPSVDTMAIAFRTLRVNSQKERGKK
jgi:hypothetical protein